MKANASVVLWIAKYHKPASDVNTALESVLPSLPCTAIKRAVPIKVIIESENVPEKSYY